MKYSVSSIIEQNKNDVICQEKREQPSYKAEAFTSKEGYQFDFFPLQFIKVILKSLNEKAQKSTACLS